MSTAYRPPTRGMATDAGWQTRFWRGVVAGASVVLLGLFILAVPVMLAWIVPGSDSVSAASALRAAALALLSGLHGGLVLGGQLSTLAPLVVTLLLGWLVCGPARRLESTSGFLGLATGFTGSCWALAAWSHLGQTYAPGLRTSLAAGIFVLLVGVVARCAPVWWLGAGLRERAVLRAAAAAVASYLGFAALLVAALLVLHHGEVVGIQTRVAPGSGGLAILLLGVGAAPNAVIAAVGYLTGFGFQVGPATSVSPRAVSRAPIPDFPLLGALPHSGAGSVIGFALVAVSALVAAVAVVGVAKPSGRGWRGLADLATVALLAGGVLALSGLLARGGIGNAGLRGIGVQGWQIGVGAASCLGVGSVVCATVQRILVAVAPTAVPVLHLVEKAAAEEAAVEEAAVEEAATESTADEPDTDEQVVGSVQETG